MNLFFRILVASAISISGAVLTQILIQEVDKKLE
jgi:hypothetical protein